MVALSFSDSDLGGMAAAWKAFGDRAPSLRGRRRAAPRGWKFCRDYRPSTRVRCRDSGHQSPIPASGWEAAGEPGTAGALSVT